MRSNTEEFIKKAINKHGNKYNYSKVEYIKSNQKVFIICNNCKLEFLQKPSAHINGNGCSDCAHKEVAKHNTKSFDNFLELAKNIHKDNETGLDKYDYSLAFYINTSTKINIKCNNCKDIFFQTPHSHLKGEGCSICAENRRIDALRYSQEDFINKSKNAHQNDYDYSFVNYIDSDTMVIIKCNNCNRKFDQYPSDHIRGRGCSNCAFSRHKMEKEWLDFIGIPEEYRTKVIKLNNRIFKLDAYNPIINIIYEFYGDYWHGNPKVCDPQKTNGKNGKSFEYLYKKTLERADILKSAGYDIVYIWESDWLAQKKAINKNAKK